jgi:CheY-like chemotaxis protein
MERYKDAGLLYSLVIDDDPEMCRLLTRILLAEGHQCVTAGSAEEGLAQLPFYTFDVAFLDQRLPGIQGLVFGEYLRENNPEMTVTLVTAESDERLDRVAAAHGIAVIEKPFEVDAILKVVERHRAGVAARREQAAAEGDPAFAPPVAEHLDALDAFFHPPGVPQRLQDLLDARIRDALHGARGGAPGHQGDRVAAFAGLLAARVLGVRLPHLRDGHSLYDEYDDLMVQQGRRVEFRRPGPPPPPPPERDDA